MNAVPGARTQTTLPLSPPQSNMAPPSEDNGKVKKDIARLPWRCAHHIRVIYTVNGMLLCLGYGCSSASPPCKKRKLKWYGHVSRSSGLAKTILQGTVRGGRRRGRQKKRWEDNIKEWTGMEFADSQRAVENRETWRELVRKSSMVPQRSLRVMGK